MTSVETAQTRLPLRAAPTPIVDLSNIDLDAMAISRDGLEKWLPHRGVMAMLDCVIWHHQTFSHAVAVKHVKRDEFWTQGHFPGQPMMPGVLMVEAGAQLANVMFKGRSKSSRIAVFVRIDKCAFRGQVSPGQDLLLLGREVKYNPKRFISDIQGMVDEKLVFEARITGMVI